MEPHLYPIPKSDLLKRFSPVFTQFQTTRHATIVALPYAGRSSHLRFISSQPDLQIELGKPSSDQFVWLESQSAKSFTQLATIICLALDPTLLNHPTLVSQDDFLILALLKSLLATLSHPIILCVTLNRANLEIQPEIENQMTLLIKQAPNLKILWSIDSACYRQYNPGHASTPIIESVYFFPTFSKAETLHSLKRIALNRDKSLSKHLESQSLELTGGLAGLFHLLIFQGESYLHLPGTQEIINSVSQELRLSSSFSSSLSTLELDAFLSITTTNAYTLGPLKLKTSPTAQELSLLKVFLEKENQPLSRDEVAVALWGNQSTAKYSDWAIDKAISRLRENLDTKTYQLTTIKGLGYTLICLTR